MINKVDPFSEWSGGAFGSMDGKQFQTTEYDYSAIPAGTVIECAQKLHSVRFVAGSTVEETKFNRETTRTGSYTQRTKLRFTLITANINQNMKRLRDDIMNEALDEIEKVLPQAMPESLLEMHEQHGKILLEIGENEEVVLLE